MREDLILRPYHASFWGTPESLLLFLFGTETTSLDTNFARTLYTQTLRPQNISPLKGKGEQLSDRILVDALRWLSKGNSIATFWHNGESMRSLSQPVQALYQTHFEEPPV